MLTNKEKRDLLLAGGEKFDWQAEDPERNGDEWPGFDNFDAIENNCFCCEIDSVGKMNCLSCPVIWTSMPKQKIRGAYCTAPDSPFYRANKMNSRGFTKIASSYFRVCAELHREAAAKIPVEEEGTSTPFCFSREAIIGKRDGIDMPVAFKPSSSSNEVWEKDANDLVYSRNTLEAVKEFIKKCGTKAQSLTVYSDSIHVSFADRFNVVEEARSLFKELDL